MPFVLSLVTLEEEVEEEVEGVWSIGVGEEEDPPPPPPPEFLAEEEEEEDS